MFDLFGRDARRLLHRDRDWHATDMARASDELRRTREERDAALARAREAESALHQARRVIDVMKADVKALRADRDRMAMEASAAFELAESSEADAEELRRLIGNARNQLDQADGAKS